MSPLTIYLPSKIADKQCDNTIIFSYYRIKVHFVTLFIIPVLKS